MTTINVNNTTLKNLSTAYSAANKADGKLNAAFDALYAEGVRSAHLTKGAPDFNIEVHGAVVAAIVAGALESGERKLFLMSVAEAKGQNVSARRNDVTRKVASYVANVRRALDLRDPTKQAEKAKAKAKAETIKKSTGDAGEQETTTTAPKPSESVGKVNPRASREAFCEALNVMISAVNTHEDRLVKAHADDFRATFSRMLAQLSRE